MRILVVTPTVPWPARSGSQLRIAATVDALSAHGDVDLFTMSPDGPFGSRSLPASAPVAAWHAGAVTLRPRGTATRARLVLGRQPVGVALLDDAPARRELAMQTARYDLIWCYRAETVAVLESQLEAACVVDIDDLEAVKLRGQRRAAGTDARRGTGLRQRARAVAADRDARRWERFQLDAIAAVDVAVVASDADRARLGVAELEVLPNTYPAPDVPMGRLVVGHPPVISFIGLQTYPPNADAVRHLAREIAPRVRQEEPSVEVRVVGRHDDALVEACPGVTFVGAVDAVEPELARTDVVAVPLRFGSGTRVKILEAFAHRVPVVSTPIGADGLAVRDGEHVLLADDPDAFARACVRLLRDVELRRRLTAAAHELWLDRHSAAPFRRRIDDVVRRAMRPDGVSEGLPKLAEEHAAQGGTP